MGVELGLIALYLAAVFFAFDPSTKTGLIGIVILSVVFFPLVLIIEKKREKAAQMESGTPVSQEVQVEDNPQEVVQEPVQPVPGQQIPQQQVQPESVQPTQNPVEQQGEQPQQPPQ